MRSRHLQVAIVTAILAVGLTAAGWSYVAERDRGLSRLDAIATSEADQIQDAFELLAGVARGTAVAIDRAASVDEVTFDEVIAELELRERFPAVIGMVMIERVARDELAGWEREQQRDDPSYQLIADAGEGTLWPVRFAYPASVHPVLLGADLRLLPEVARAADEAVATGQPQLSGATELISQGDGLPGAVLLVPFVEQATGVERAFGIGLSNESFLEAVEPLGAAIHVTLRDPDNERFPVVLEVGDRPVGDLVETRSIGLPTGSWSVEVRPAPGFDTTGDVLLPWLLAATTAAVALAAWVAIGALTSRERRASQLADQRTAELRDAVSDLADANAELQALNRQLREADELKDRFLASVSHELRTPLTVIGGFAETLQRLPPADEQARDELLGPLRRNVRRLEALVTDLLLLASLDAGRMRANPEPVEIRPVVDRLATDLALEGDGILRNEVPAGLVATVDPRHLEHILVNLLANADKHGGPPIEVTAARAGAQVRLAVRDHGPGLGEDDPARLLERFERGRGVEHATGTGLGLAIVAELVALGEGTVRLSNANPGTRVEVSLRA